MKYSFVLKYLKRKKRRNCNLKLTVKMCFSHCIFLSWYIYILTNGFMLYQSLFMLESLDQICRERFSPNSLAYLLLLFNSTRPVIH